MQPSGHCMDAHDRQPLFRAAPLSLSAARRHSSVNENLRVVLLADLGQAIWDAAAADAINNMALLNTWDL